MAYMPKFVRPTLVEAVRALARDTARGFVFVRPDGTERFCSFAALAAESERRAAHLTARGMKKGDRLALVVPDPDEFVLSFLGALFAGVVPVPIYPQLTFKNVDAYHETVAHIARASTSSFLLTTRSTREYVDPVLGKVEGLRGILEVGELAETPPAAPGVKVKPEDVAFLQFTSGSTSRPKGVVVTHANLAANSEAFMVHGLGKDSAVDKGVSWLPLYHDMGLIGFVVGPLFTDVPCVFLPTATFVRSPRVWLDAIHKHRGTITYAPNFAYALVAKRLKERDVAGLDLSCLRIAGCGAEPIQPKSLREFAEKLAPAKFRPEAFVPSYGMAEATLAITFMPRDQGLHTDKVDPQRLGRRVAEPARGDPAAAELVDCGTPFPEHEIAIVDETGRRLGEREVGQILTRGPSICPGYHAEPELTRETFRDGWLHTGDLGYRAGGHLFVCGRLKDILIIRGRNYYPHDIEWTVGELPGIRRGNVVAFGIDVEGEEQLVVCAEAFQSESAGLADAIAARIAEQIGLSPHKVEIVPQGALPRTSSGKAQRRKAKQMYLDGTLGRARSVQEKPEKSGDNDGAVPGA